MFKTTCKVGGYVWDLGVDNECEENVVAAIVVDKLKLQTTIHPKPYLAGWISNGH